MSFLDLEEPWGQLVSIESDEEQRIPIVGRGITIGRGKGVCHCSNIRVGDWTGICYRHCAHR